VSPHEVLAVSKFGNVLVAPQDGAVWRICPEDLAHDRVLDSIAGLERLRGDPEFRADWEMARLVALAETAHGVLPPDRCF
jgi:hypothetical protein